MEEWTNIRVRKSTVEKLRKIDGANDDERLKFLLGEDKFHDTFLTEEEARKIVKEEIKKVSSY